MENEIQHTLSIVYLRKVIDGESLISTMEKLNGVREVEQVIDEGRAKRQKASKKLVPKLGES